ncbi:Uncharacterized protein Adt_14471 [Abeliophyllum distichum]|uniref:Zinc finger PMZ-type domain-containing protein n=1 Tax=Abeliophyllum distichum TaxID=126358 RepID=A0ABD1TZT0_9LAMI
MKKLSGNHIATYSGNMNFEVRDMHGGVHAMALSSMTCSYRSWHLSELPCVHVMTSLSSRRMQANVMDYVASYYKKEAYLKTYSSSISLIPGLNYGPMQGSTH